MVLLQNIDYNYYPSPDFIPEKLIFAPIPFYPPHPVPYTKALISSVMSEPLKELFSDAWNKKIYIYGISGYRSYYRQLEIYNSSIKNKGYDHTRKYIATPGTSEHQTGLALDISCPSIGYELEEIFAHTNEGIWLKGNCMKYGFRITYDIPDENNCHSPYIAYEPWHIYYCE